jgi:hypothetical protein
VTEDRPIFYQIDVANLTRMTAPAYGTISHLELNSLHVLRGDPGLLLIGPLGINYWIEGSDKQLIFLRRWDRPSVRSNNSVTLFVTTGGPREGRTYKESGPRARSDRSRSAGVDAHP